MALTWMWGCEVSFIVMFILGKFFYGRLIEYSRFSKIVILFFFKDKDTDKVGSVAIAEMLDRTNLIAIVSGGNYPIITPNSVLIWDDDAKEFALEYTFKSKVFAVKMSHKK